MTGGGSAVPDSMPRSWTRLKDGAGPLCSSTCFHTMGFYYKLAAVPEWVRKHIRVG